MAETNQFGQQVGDLLTDRNPSKAPEPVTLEGRYVEVRPLTSAQYSDLYEATCHRDAAHLWTYRPVASGRPTSLPELWMHLAAINDSPDLVGFALVPKEGPRAGRACGVAIYAQVVPEHARLEIAGVLFGDGLGRTRAATESLHLLMQHAFDELGYRRVEWKCDSLNEASRRAAQRLGFVAEGRFRRHMVSNGRNRDTDWFSIIDEEWPALRAAHQRWLDPANFDATGRQHTPIRQFWSAES
ncbi:MAG: GNAT family N-acetyltransferase [Nocardioidaceae bacterium]|nr:GNAT family N-acetyltransferase [Nocardioidaceae bacterium]